MTAIDSEINDAATAHKPDLYRRIAWRLLPFLFVGYILAFLDRVNVGFAAIRMQADLGFSAAVYGFGAGIFFIGYVLCEVPSNILLAKIGARKTFTRIMIGWGMLSASTMFVQTPMQFYIVRFFLGAFEAGFGPGVILYLTYWFPTTMRGAIVATFGLAIPISGIVGAPISGFVMSHMDGVNGWHGWQWMFLIEGVPTAFFGLLAAFMLTDKPSEATWLTDGERSRVIAEVGTPSSGNGHGLKDVVRDPRVYSLGYVFFAIASGIYVISFWLPTLIRDYGVIDPFNVGLLSAIPYLAGGLGMVVIGRHSDLRRERRWHTAVCMILGALGLVLSTFLADSLPLGLAVLSLASFGLFGAYPVFWAIPMRYFSHIAAAAGIALVNTIAQLSGMASPAIIGWIKTATGSTNMGLYLFAGVLCVGAVLLVRGMPAKLIAERDRKQM
ncbi:MFS transporter [Bradyrhizobium ottawaense]|uniref:MFS transporter n=1 Tax=Bradyrhizobium ottawaense TaxID=931866 RepID=UPI0003FDFE78|nr:MFS transporter [Bradyrhizobium ottawaense]